MAAAQYYLVVLTEDYENCEHIGLYSEENEATAVAADLAGKLWLRDPRPGHEFVRKDARHFRGKSSSITIEELPLNPADALDHY